MKRSIIIILTAFVTFLAACYKDKGNYDYHDINDVKISGLAASYTYVLGTSLHIEPKIQMSQTDDTLAVNYYWILTTGDTPLDTIGTSAVLDARMNVKTADYGLVLRVVDKASGVAYKATTKVTVSTPFSTGMLLMGTDDNGNAEAEMISMVKDTIVFHNILSKSGLPTLRDPMSFAMMGGRGDTSSNQIRLWAMTKSGSYYLDRNSMAGSTGRKFGNICVISDNLNKDAITPVVLMPQVKDRAGTAGSSTALTWCRGMISTDGDIYVTHALLNAGDYYGNPINRLDADYSKRLKAAPYFWYSLIDIGLSAAFVWFDTENQRFMVYEAFSNTGSNILPDAAGDIFSWNLASQNRTLVYGENTRNTDGGSKFGNSFAIVKDNTGKHYIYKFYANTKAPIKRDLYTVLPIATDFDKAGFYAFSSNRPVVFYTVGNKLYAYDYNKGLEKSYQFPELSTDEITMLKMDTQIDGPTNSLYVATYNAATKGRLRRYMVGTNPNFVDITPVDRSDWDGLVKIKDMNWRGAN
jgi:hypothetical protein